MKTLAPSQIREVESILAERHPLYYNGSKLHDVFPFLKNFRCFYKPDRNASDTVALLSDPDTYDPNTTEERRMEQLSSDQILKEQKKADKSFMDLGFGTIAYFDIHFQLAIIFFIILVLSLPSIYLFAFYSEGNRHYNGLLHSISIGNLGFSSTLCKDTSLAVNRLNLICATGRIEEIVDFGVIPNDASILDACMANSETRQCEGVYEEKKVRQKLQRDCVGRNSCVVRPREFVNEGLGKCTSKYAQFFGQVMCKHSVGQLKERAEIGNSLMVQALLTAGVYLAGMWYIRKSTKDRYEEWDRKTTTISDYTVKYNVPEVVYKDFLLSHGMYTNFQPSDGDISAEFEQESPIYAFKKELKRQVEDKLRQSSPVIYDSDDLIEISEINFTFMNTEVISMLIERGDALDTENESKVIEIENKIKDYLKNFSDQVSTPQEAYITFRTEEAYLRGIRMDSTSICGREVPRETWKGHPFVLEQVQEPSNIYWENRHTSLAWKLGKQVISTVILILILAFFIVILFYTMKIASRIRREYPQVDCDGVKGDLVDDEMLEHIAKTEWFHRHKSHEIGGGDLKLSTSNLQCYCDDFKQDLGRKETMKLTETVEIGGEIHSGFICEDYLKSDRILFFISLVVPLLIIVSNQVIKHVSVFLCKWIGFDKRTNEISMIQILCFAMLFFNNALVIFLLNARFVNFPVFNELFDGDHEDFDNSWYREIAPFIISPMFIQIIFPIQNFLPDLVIQQGLAWLDRRFTSQKLYKTNCNTALQYAELNSGTDHALFEKYPRLVNIVMLSMMYAFQLPIFLILTFICLIFSYIFDKVAVAYYHRKPPLYDDTLNNVSVHIMKWGAAFYLCLCYWVVSNRQMFGNVLEPKHYQEEIDIYHHYIFVKDPYVFQSVLRWTAITLIVIFAAYDIFNLFSILFISSSSKEELQSLEYLPDLTHCIPLKYIENALMEEKIIREKFGYKKMFDATVQDFFRARMLRSGKIDRQLTSQGSLLFADATSFDILRQPNYYEKFNYIIPAERKKDLNYDECDEVRRVLDFAFYKGQYHIDELFSYRDPAYSLKRFYDTGRIPTIKPKQYYR
ncbi:unnamed protein product [Moneuplotes crassus]|uniref:Uncharacterized protein n=1 Tax=Euplotes crassus TaxID=5936 RepID=A0AAD1XQB1_EUPCR|nr:unnamed protein product [Moneuplotes crassus]